MKGYTLHARQRKLLYLLNCKHGTITGRELSDKIGVSERTIRNDIVEINQFLEGYKITIKAIRGKGYYLQVEDRAILHELFSDIDHYQTKEDRINYLILKLVESNGWIDIRELEDDLFVSRTTLENDLKDIRNLITENQPFLPLLRNGNYIRLDESEIKKRNILIRIYSENWDFNSQDGIHLKEAIVNQKSLQYIRLVIKNALNKYGFELDDYGMIYLMMAFAISYFRILEGHELQATVEKCSRSSLIQTATEMWDRLKEVWEIEVNQAEYDWIAEIIEKLIILNFRNYTVEDALKIVDPECNEILKLLIEEIHNRYALDLSEDINFFTHMLLHIQAIRNNMISIQTQSQYIIEELRLKYPYLGDIANYICNRLAKYCDRKLGQEEEDYILPVLIMARNNILLKKSKNEMKVAVVSHLNGGLSHYFMNRLKLQYGLRIKFYGPFPIYDRSKIDKLEPSFVITTVPMDMFRKFEMPVITVSPLLKEEDMKKIESCLETREEEYLYPVLPDSSHIFRRELLVSIDRRVSLEETLNILEENLRSNLYLDEEIKIDWRQCYKAILENGILFLYVIGNEAQKTIISIASCKHMLVWNQVRNIKKVVVLILNKNERKYLGSYYQLINKYANSFHH